MEDMAFFVEGYSQVAFKQGYLFEVIIKETQELVAGAIAKDFISDVEPDEEPPDNPLQWAG